VVVVLWLVQSHIIRRHPLNHGRLDGNRCHHSSHKVCYPNKISIVDPASNYEDILPKPLMESLDPSIIRFVRPHGHQFYDASHSIRADGDYSHHSDHRGCYPNKISIVNPMSNKQEILLFLVSSKICEV
jgi:hypothetical protein